MTIVATNNFFCFSDTATPDIYTTANTLSLHDALPISPDDRLRQRPRRRARPDHGRHRGRRSEEHTSALQSLAVISYAVFCLTKKKLEIAPTLMRVVSLANINTYVVRII